jgi:hypothetical protein
MNIRERLAEQREAWVDLPVHPEAAKLPMMADEELEELARDIEANGLQKPIILWRDNRGEAKGEAGPPSEAVSLRSQGPLPLAGPSRPDGGRRRATP